MTDTSIQPDLAPQPSSSVNDDLARFSMDSPTSFNPGHNHTANSNGVQVLIDATSITSDWGLGNRCRVTLGNNRTLANPINALDGQSMIYEIIQDGTGSRTLAFGSKFTFGTTITAATLSTTASARDFIGVIYNLTTDKFYIVGFVKGY